MGQQQPGHVSSASKWLRVITPCLLAAVFCAYVVIVSFIDIERTAGWSVMGIAIFLPALITLLLLDAVVKHFFKRKLLALWLVEMVLIAVGVWCFFHFI